MNAEVLMQQLGELFSYQEKSPLLFSSGQFLILFVVFYGLYLLIYNQIAARLFYLTAFSLFFYYKSSGGFVLLFGATIVLNYAAGLWLPKVEKGKGWLLFGLILLNLAPLLYYKYANFFLDNLNLFGAGLSLINGLILPVGISFFTFQTISYLVDIYKKDIAPCDNLLDFAFYLSFFPQLVAGPIVRASDFISQIRRPIVIEGDAASQAADFEPAQVNYISQADLSRALFMILTGFIKKAVIANYVAQYADLIYGIKPGESAVLNYSGFENLMAMYAYTLQIYCDFSGYSDMAIGLSMLMGFKLLDNFNSPYVSKSITEFWRRWHISLSFWLRDYIYIALGGNRKGEALRYVFLMTTMLVGGFWHGASWKFVFWGAMHGAALVLHKLWSEATKEAQWRKSYWWQALAWLLTFHFVAFLWVFFRVFSFEEAFWSIQKIFTDMDWGYLPVFCQVRQLLVAMMLFGFYTHFVQKEDKKRLQTYVYSLPLSGKIILFVLLIQLALQLQSADVQPFIYFQF